MKAILFDMDGVIVDSERYWKKSKFTFIQSLIPNWEKEDGVRITGLTMKDAHHLLVHDYGLTLKWKDFMTEVDKRATVIYQKKTHLLPYFLKTIRAIKARTESGDPIKIGLVSSSPLSWIKMVLDRFKLRHFFDVVVSAEDAVLGKPAPDLYLTTAKKLNVQTKWCVAIEDSKNGAMAAKSAGMFCVGLRNGFNEAQDLSMADVQVEGFGKLDIEEIMTEI